MKKLWWVPDNHKFTFTLALHNVMWLILHKSTSWPGQLAKLFCGLQLFWMRTKLSDYSSSMGEYKYGFVMWYWCLAYITPIHILEFWDVAQLTATGSLFWSFPVLFYSALLIYIPYAFDIWWSTRVGHLKLSFKVLAGKT